MEHREAASASSASSAGGSYASVVRPTDLSLGEAFREFEGPRIAWVPPAGHPRVAGGAVATLTADGQDRFERVRLAADRLGPFEVDAPARAPATAHPWFVGGFAYDERGADTATWRGFDGARFVLPRFQLTAADGATWLTATGPSNGASLPDAIESFEAKVTDGRAGGGPPPGIARTERRPDRATWREQVRAAIDRIRAGELEKVVLAQRLFADLHGPVRIWEALERLGARYPGCFRFAIDPGVGRVFLGATPERLVSLRDGSVRTEALAGSIGRGGTPAEDDRLAEQLRTSSKAREEHAVVVDTVRRQLERVADRVSVSDRTIRKLANVQHLATRIGATVSDGTHVLDVAAALHPTPAVGGRPPDTAQAFIRRTERFDRGWYAAPIGWFAPSGDGTFAVGIRSAVVHDHRATLFAGNGIVADSDPDAEWEELQLKYRPILDTLRADAP